MSLQNLSIFGAQYLIVVPVLTLIAYFVFGARRQKHRLLWLSVVSLPLAYALARLAGHLYNDPRPFVVGNFMPLVSQAADNGFPSDHTLVAATIAMIVLYFNRRLGIFLWIVAVTVGVSRVLAGVHHPVDIIASIIIAIVSIVAGHYILYYIRREHKTYVSS